MDLAPEPYLSACLAVIQDAVLASRVYCWQKSASSEQIADLMDSIHNIPSLLVNWQKCDVEWLRVSLQGYDEKWVGKPWLCDVFDKAVQREQRAESP